MALEIIVTSERLKADPASRNFIEVAERDHVMWGVESGVLYYDFPVYSDYDVAAHRPDILLYSAAHGFVAVRFMGEGLFGRGSDTVEQAAESLNDFCSNLYSRLVRSRDLRKGRNQLLFEITPVIFNPGADDEVSVETESGEYVIICKSYQGFAELLGKIAIKPLNENINAEVRSIAEGAKALTRPSKRIVSNPSSQPLAVAMATLEAEIANFDQKQRKVAIVDVGGPARIRGLAGSGKTVILAMKAAQLHLSNPDHTILVTFYTKSLRATLKNLVTKFFRHYSETDPDWKKIHIRHGWGGSSVPGVYADACRRNGKMPLRFSDAQSGARKSGGDAFGYACSELISSVDVKPYYDHVLIDEGQDFPGSFYQLCYKLTKGERDRKSIVWAYDELQNILNVQIRTPEELFGRGEDGEPLVSLDRSAASVPPGATNDAVLSKCYRNQRRVLVTAHALGFGVYGDVVQMLESEDHWRDVGYELKAGDYRVGNTVTLTRPVENSPLELNDVNGFPLIDWKTFADLHEEVRSVAAEVKRFTDGGLLPEEILIVALDDRHARTYFRELSSELATLGLKSNNIIADPYNEPPFTIEGHVTLSTVYRAKGNEAAAVFAIGTDAVDTKSRGGRNKLFTAFTRTKAWLRVSGTNVSNVTKIVAELSAAVGNSPDLTFRVPDIKQIELIQRDISKREAKLKAAREKYVKELRALGLTDEEIEEEVSSMFQK